MARWPDERVIGDFWCHADFPLEERLDDLIEVAQLPADLNRQLEIPPPQEPIHLFLFRRESTYRQYVREYFPDVPYRRALYVKDGGPGMVFAYCHDDFAVDLRHECTHALLHAALPVVPLWVDEGLAEYFEVPRDERFQRRDHWVHVRRWLRFGRKMPWDDLEQLKSLRQMGHREYVQAWALVHYMLHGDASGRETLIAFLAELKAHRPPGRLTERLRQAVPELDQRLQEHFAP